MVIYTVYLEFDDAQQHDIRIIPIGRITNIEDFLLESILIYSMLTKCDVFFFFLHAYFVLFSSNRSSNNSSVFFSHV